MVSFDVFVVKALWGNMLFDFATSSARGRSCGILCVWDKSLFHKKRTYATENCLCVEGGYSFTWSDKHASKMSKLDRFLVSPGTLGLFPNLTSLILHRHISNHRPILLKETHVDYGPTLFRLYHSWFLEDDSYFVIEDSWNNDGVSASNSMDHDRKVIQDSLIEIDLCLDKGNCLPDDLSKRATLFRDLKDIDKKDSIDLAQNAKIKWAVRLDYDQACDLEGVVSNEEIKMDVWDCGSDKSPGPDGFTFIFLKKFWPIVGGDVTNAVKEFFNSSSFPKGCNSSFIALVPKVMDAKHLNDFRPISLIGCQYKIIGKILANRLSLMIGDIVSQEQSAFIKGRQIMDGSLNLNEVISWCKARKDQILLFKVDFQKAYDSVRWDHLDDILGKFDFGNKWRGWIRGCLHYSKASVLVNGSPTNGFSFHRGLRQGDPLSPFLFILVMESLHVSFQRLIDRGTLDPIFVGKENMVHISHLFYADDAMFIGNNLPFTYMGVKVGANMMRLKSWSEVMLCSVSLSSANDRWSWTLHGLGEFSVKSAREEIDKHVLVVSPSHSRWSKADTETRNHLFFGCSMSLDLARLIGRWWNIHIPSFGDPSSWETLFNGLNLSSLQKRIMEATFVSMWWHIWKFSNSSPFSSKKPRKEMIFDDIVSHTFFWVNNRCRKFNVSRVAWLNDPLNAL
uniref:RNA-directed DNA polymerase, eukaryota, reverse transcriptase zinc-binding domain protein n=1 Tax=Tanacetum cinerariifolium TaxID=118510 RepID=A0A6L2MFJ9_TANCI|nr:RNA-directed DNA polymerase, eukaryota, reverse transcriptase zinc-binding domain protein [Tanacetum cinerariifolium]